MKSTEAAANVMKGSCFDPSKLTNILMNYLWALCGTNLFGIKFAPWNIPLERRLQTLAAAAWIFYMALGGIFTTLITVIIIRSDFYWVMLLYIAHIANKRDDCHHGSKHWSWVRNWRWWYLFKDYFPVKLVKTVDLDPGQNYLFCSFPHGFLSTGSFVSFATDACDFRSIFPDMTPYTLTLAGNFMVPFAREILSWLGMASASAESINYLLDKKKGTGKCAVLVVGGAAEALNCHSGQYAVVLKNRKGFVKIAMKNGAPLVPVISFGETELYEQPANPKGSITRKLQEWVKSITGLAPVIPLGRGIFQYNFGFLPQRKPVTTVVGVPMGVARNVDPTDEEINTVHQQFIDCLIDMFEKEKYNYISNPEETKLIIE